VNLLISVFEAPSASKVASGIAVKSKSVRSERDRVLGWHGRRHRIAACLSCEMPRGAANGPRPSEVGDQSGRARKRRAFVEQRGSALLDAQPIVVRRAACLRHSRRPVLQRNGPTRRNLAAASAGQLPTSSSARSHVRWPWLLWLGRAGGPTAGWELLLHPVLCDFWLRVCHARPLVGRCLTFALSVCLLSVVRAFASTRLSYGYSRSVWAWPEPVGQPRGDRVLFAITLRPCRLAHSAQCSWPTPSHCRWGCPRLVLSPGTCRLA